MVDGNAWATYLCRFDICEKEFFEDILEINASDSHAFQKNAQVEYKKKTSFAYT